MISPKTRELPAHIMNCVTRGLPQLAPPCLSLPLSHDLSRARADRVAVAVVVRRRFVGAVIPRCRGRFHRCVVVGHGRGGKGYIS